MSASPAGVALAGKVGFLEDPEGTLVIADMLSGAVDHRFSIPPGAVQQAGLDNHARWFKIRIRQTEQTGEWLIDSTNTALRTFDVYGPYSGNGAMLAPPSIQGYAQAAGTRWLNSDRFNFRFALAQPGDYTIFIRTTSDFAEYYSFMAWEPVQFGHAEQRHSMFNGICYGLFIGMIFYNLVLLWIFDESLYFYNFLSCLFALLTLSGINGHLGHYVLDNHAGLIPIVLGAAPALWIAFAGMFGRGFLELQKFAPRLNWCMLALMPLASISVALAICGQFSASLALTQLLSVAGPLLMFAGAIIALRRGFTPAAWYITGISTLFLAAICTTLNNNGIVQFPFHYEALQIGSLFEIIVFIIALGSRIRSIRQQNGELGRRAKQLAKTARTDPLTGVFNRAGWAHYAARTLNRGGSAALLLIDLDKFKPVNDQHGHAAGDQVLKVVAERLRAEVDAQGVVARLGGDEFVILLAHAPDSKVLAAQAGKLIDLISLPVPYQGSALSVSASIGIACVPQDGADLSMLMHAADRAMYEIKENGRAGHGFACTAAS
ncbi:sensor domain-containing diguanylate cyclase [Duganella sp. PWIR1]